MFDVTPKILDRFITQLKDDVDTAYELPYGKTHSSIPVLTLDDLDDLLELSDKMKIPSLAKFIEVYSFPKSVLVG